MSDQTVVVVGASLAGVTSAATIRDSGHDGPIVVLDPSPELPPDRPPLSKQVLAGLWEPEQATSRAASRMIAAGVDLRLGVAAVSLDAGTRTVTTSDGDRIDAAGIVIATGASPRRLGDQLAGVHVLRTLEDCLALRAELDDDPARVAVIGAGFIGAEVAATCRGRGLDVTMIEAAPLPLGRVLPGDIGGFIVDLHRGHGVDVRLGVGVDALAADDEGRVRVVRMADGTDVEATVVVVGIGVVPSIAWLEGSGLVLDDGVSCDETLLAAPGIVAAGDVASWPNRRFGQVMRVEQWENAVEQGEHAGRRVLAEMGLGESPGAFRPIPWFWSDQYDRKLQMAGRPSGEDVMEVVEGSIEEQRFVALFRRGDTACAVLGVNRPRHVMQARMAMVESLDWAPVRGLFQ
ncbi:MAG: FAD/NAD(P)-binding oxidoreductase [Microthrixaceae bacterium]